MKDVYELQARLTEAKGATLVELAAEPKCGPWPCPAKLAYLADVLTVLHAIEGQGDA